MNFTAKTTFATALVALGLISAPLYAQAASKDACEFEGSAGIDAGTLLATTSRPTISGTASTTRTVQLVIRKEGSEKTYYQSKVIKVKKGDEWSTRVTKKLKDGEYDVSVYCPKANKKGSVIATGTLVVGEREAAKGTVVTVSSVPLLNGGTAVAGQSVPVSYLQVKNTGKGDVTVKGFWVKQNGSASADVIDSFTVIDGTGDSRVTTDIESGDPLLSGKATFVKTNITIATGGFSLFTIKANLDSSLGSEIGEDLEIVVTGADGAAKTKGAFPIYGTTWELR